jgi:hypothetical protein
MSIIQFMRMCTITVSLLWVLTATINAGGVNAAVESQQLVQNTIPAGTIPPVAPVLINDDFECTTGYYAQTNGIGQEILIPNGWQAAILTGSPRISSARIFFAKSCDGSAHVERINGIDSIVIRAQDLEAPPEPGKPFDVAFYQPISATIGGGYSLSGWLLSLCGGSATPSDCPKDQYIAKMIGIDPTGGIDPDGESVVWTENRRNFWEEGKRVGWQQMSVSAVAEATTITIFARINSPFRWHGNHAFIDALSVVRAPVAALTVPATVTGTQIALQWEGLQSPDIEAIAGGTHELRYDIQFRHSSAKNWSDLLLDRADAGPETITVNCSDTIYEFRIRTRAEQPPAPAPAGAWPNHRYHSVWSAAIPVELQSKVSLIPSQPVDLPGPFQIFLPQVAHQKPC